VNSLFEAYFVCEGEQRAFNENALKGVPPIVRAGSSDLRRR
jgi:hypothetical protein